MGEKKQNKKKAAEIAEEPCGETPGDTSISLKKKKRGESTGSVEQMDKDNVAAQNPEVKLKKKEKSEEILEAPVRMEACEDAGIPFKKKKSKRAETIEHTDDDIIPSHGSVFKMKKGKKDEETMEMPVPAEKCDETGVTTKKKERKSVSSTVQMVEDTTLNQESLDHSKKEKKNKKKKHEERAIDLAADEKSEDASVPKKKKKLDTVDNTNAVAESALHEKSLERPEKKKSKKKEHNVGPSSSLDAKDTAQTATPSKTKKPTAFEVEGITDELVNDNTDVSSPNKKKKKKSSGDVSVVNPGANGDATVLDETESQETPRKKKKKEKDAATTVTTKQPEGEYVIGSLSSIFGKGSTVPVESENTIPIVKGEAVIKPKTKKVEQEQDVDVDNEQSSSQEEQIHKRKDRVRQRENRKKEQKMGLDEKKRTIFVGNAPLSMDERSCRKLFSQYGPIESVRMRSVMPPKETITKRIAHMSHTFHEKQNSLNFYVKFKEEDSVQKALTYNGTIVDRHRIRVDTCTTKAEYDRNLTVFVGNLPLDVKDDELAEFFEENVGGVSFVRCVRDASSGMGKGIAFVIFKSTTSLPLALSMNGVEYQKRELRITKVMKKAKVAKVQQARKKSGGVQQPKLNKEQEEKINKFKFSTKKPQQNDRPMLKKKARKAIQRKKSGKPMKSLMQ